MSEEQSANRAVRLIAIRDLLCGGGAYTAGEMAERMVVDHRMINRDLLDLQGAPLYTPIIQWEGGRYQVIAFRECLTPADLIARGLDLEPLDVAPEPTPIGAVSAISGKPLKVGYRAADFVTPAMNDAIGLFHNSLNGWISDNEVRLFKNAAPKLGNMPSRSVLVFEDGSYYWPLISGASAGEKGRPCWSDLVRAVWPERKGERMVMILSTDTKKRLWPRAEVGALGQHTPIYGYDGATGMAQVLYLDWARMLACLDDVETVYSLGFSKDAIRMSLLDNWNVMQQVGMRETQRWERALADWRPSAEFWVAAMIAQKKEQTR